MSNEELLSEANLHRLNERNDDARTLIFVCQPGKDELDEYLLRAIGAGEILNFLSKFLFNYHF
jgi:hypothetical protein